VFLQAVLLFRAPHMLCVRNYCSSGDFEAAFNDGVGAEVLAAYMLTRCPLQRSHPKPTAAFCFSLQHCSNRDASSSLSSFERE
jgi:hypothetical protein